MRVDPYARWQHFLEERDRVLSSWGPKRIAEYEKNFLDRRVDLIAAMQVAGHHPVVRTRWFGAAELGAGPVTRMYCRDCGAKFRGWVVHRWWGLSPRRTCPAG